MPSGWVSATSHTTIAFQTSSTIYTMLKKITNLIKWIMPAAAKKSTCHFESQHGWMPKVNTNDSSIHTDFEDTERWGGKMIASKN